MSRLGETIRELREKARMTRKALGKKCGLAESFIEEVEAGRRIVSDDQSKRILKALGAPMLFSPETDAANEPPHEPPPRPRPYVLPVSEPGAPPPEKGEIERTQASADAWLDALGGVVKRVPIIDADGTVIEHRLLPIIGGRIEGGNPDKVMYFRMEGDSLSGFRVFAGDLLLVVPASEPVDDAIMLAHVDGKRAAYKIRKADGGKLQLQTYDREFAAITVERGRAAILGACVRLERSL